MDELITQFFDFLPQEILRFILPLTKILILLVFLILIVAFLVFFERKVIGYMHARIGPNRVGPKGWFQSFADVAKLFLKEVVVPTNADRFLFLTAPLLSLIPAFAAWAVIPLNQSFIIADIDAGILYLLALTSFSVYGIILAGWASNSKYAFLGAMRSAAQMVAYEIAMGFALVGVLMAGGSLNLGVIVDAQSGGVLNWFWIPLFPMFFVYFVSGIADTIKQKIQLAVDSVKGFFTTTLSNWAHNAYVEVWWAINNITNPLSDIVNDIKNAAQNALNKVASFLRGLASKMTFGLYGGDDNQYGNTSSNSIYEFGNSVTSGGIRAFGGSGGGPRRVMGVGNMLSGNGEITSSRVVNVNITSSMSIHDIVRDVERLDSIQEAAFFNTV